jgi:hypothetical protein
MDECKDCKDFKSHGGNCLAEAGDTPEFMGCDSFNKYEASAPDPAPKRELKRDTGTKEYKAPDPAPEVKPKRKRRTAAEMAEARKRELEERTGRATKETFTVPIPEEEGKELDKLATQVASEAVKRDNKDPLDFASALTILAAEVEVLSRRLDAIEGNKAEQPEENRTAKLSGLIEEALWHNQTALAMLTAAKLIINGEDVSK